MHRKFFPTLRRERLTDIFAKTIPSRDGVPVSEPGHLENQRLHAGSETGAPLMQRLLTGLIFLAALAGLRASPIGVACVGDSITWGYGISNRESNSYPAQLGGLLGTNWVVSNFGVNATTLLHEGDLPYVRQTAYTRALAFKPDVVVIDFGANDSKHPDDGSLDADRAVNNWQYKSNFVHDYEEMIAAFRRANPPAKIFLCLPTPDYPGRWGINDKTIRVEMIPLIRRVARESQVGVIDLYTPLSGRKELFPDTVHPDATGAGLVARTVYRALTGPAPPVMRTTGTDPAAHSP